MNSAASTPLFTDFELLDLPDVQLVADLVEYWDRKRAGRVGPRRAEIDPTEIKKHLSHLIMVDVIDGGKDFRFRLIGTRIVEGLGHDNTGKRFSEAFGDRPEVLAQFISLFMLVVDRKAPVFGRGRLFWVPEVRYRRYSAGSMPLSEDGTSVSIILSEMFVEYGGRAQ
jgi:hypothetical protein